MATESGTTTVVIKSNQLVATSQITGKYNKLPITLIKRNKYKKHIILFYPSLQPSSTNCPAHCRTCDHYFLFSSNENNAISVTSMI
jgi:hypothetical protein